MRRKKRRRGITPWKKTGLKVCVFWLLLAAGLHGFRIIKEYSFSDQLEASRWGSETKSAQVSAFLPAQNALKEDDVRELEYKINTALAQDSIKLTAEGKDARLWQDCFSGIGNFTIKAGRKTADVEAVGTGGAFFTFHPLELSSGSYYQSDSLMKDEILLDQETAWKLFGSFDVTGRTVQVEDMHLRIAGVYKKGEGSLYEKGGLADYVVFVQYKTLLQYGGGGSAGQDVPATASIPSARLTGAERLLAASDGPADQDGEESVDINKDTGAVDTGTGSAGDQGTGAEASDGSGSGNGSGSGSGSAAEDSTENSGASGSAGNQSEVNTENIGTGNTAYRDTGKITAYEIVMPDPVEGYAAAVVKTALGEDTGAVVRDNTNRYKTRNLIKDIREFALLGMRTSGVHYPYWENVAVGWETIYMVLFLIECLLILFTVLLLLYMLIHWYRTKTWTVASTIRDVQDSVYERQSRKHYPEYYRELEREQEEAGMLEDKGLKPFEKIPAERKAVQYETIHQNNERSDSSRAGADNDGVRRGQQ